MKTLVHPTKAVHRDRTRTLTATKPVQRAAIPHVIQKALAEAHDPKVIAKKLAAIEEIKRIGKEVRKRLGIRTKQDFLDVMRQAGIDYVD